MCWLGYPAEWLTVIPSIERDMLITSFAVSEFVIVIVLDCRKKEIRNTAINKGLKNRWTSNYCQMIISRQILISSIDRVKAHDLIRKQLLLINYLHSIIYYAFNKTSIYLKIKNMWLTNLRVQARKKQSKCILDKVYRPSSQPKRNQWGWAPVSSPESYFHNAMCDKRGRELDHFLFLPEYCFHSVDFIYLQGK